MKECMSEWMNEDFIYGGMPIDYMLSPMGSTYNQTQWIHKVAQYKIYITYLQYTAKVK